jgi:hypothetical protein
MVAPQDLTFSATVINCFSFSTEQGRHQLHLPPADLDMVIDFDGRFFFLAFFADEFIAFLDACDTFHLTPGSQCFQTLVCLSITGWRR